MKGLYTAELKLLVSETHVLLNHKCLLVRLHVRLCAVILVRWLILRKCAIPSLKHATHSFAKWATTSHPHRSETLLHKTRDFLCKMQLKEQSLL